MLGVSSAVLCTAAGPRSASLFPSQTVRRIRTKPRFRPTPEEHSERELATKTPIRGSEALTIPRPSLHRTVTERAVRLGEQVLDSRFAQQPHSAGR